MRWMFHLLKETVIKDEFMDNQMEKDKAKSSNNIITTLAIVPGIILMFASWMGSIINPLSLLIPASEFPNTIHNSLLNLFGAFSYFALWSLFITAAIWLVWSIIFRFKLGQWPWQIKSDMYFREL